ncbi:MAG: hypothetical protein K0S07_849 [Chlamydiales bacterium]|jgi:dehypoxanthine futalosine cyclase|nr:hypothetical protein [Chlamydiales bacterium]
MGKRISFEEGLQLFRDAPLVELQAMARQARNERHPPNQVTFTLNTNPNYTNICDADCSFCAFYRHKSAKDAYQKSLEEVMEMMSSADQAGVHTVLLQGGVHSAITIDYLESLVKETKARFPRIHPHFFSAVEIWNAAKVSQIPVKEALERLWNAGQRTLPGGGAEILSEEIRAKISPKKMEPNAWIDLHTEAHRIGFKSTATMMYGHVEEPIDILNHLEALRATQDETQGFYAFIPWSYKRDRTALRRTVKNWAGRQAYFRILAFSRIYLDNFAHIGASWFGEGKEIGVQSLHYGADDFGGILVEENVFRAANFINKTDQNAVMQMIRQAGFEPALRNEYYQIVERFEGVESVAVPHLQRSKEEDQTPILALEARL